MIEKPQWRGEPAFPQYSLIAEGVFCEGGMTLRDYFAAKALSTTMQAWKPDAAARLAYEQADAMLKARDGNS
jgi:hypothetical protein